MRLEATAPNRIDLAGGTTDLFPLYLLMERGCTVNLAINVMSRATVQTFSGAGIRLVSKDLHRSVQASSIDTLDDSGPLRLLIRTIKAFSPIQDVEVITLNNAPAGSGLGASSALLVAMIGALVKLRQKEPLEPAQLIQLAINIETSVLGIPAGSQDHIAAFFGGLNLIHFDVHGFTRETVALDVTDIQTLEDMIILSYTGESRFSGMNNWGIVKSFIDRKDKTFEKLIEIRNLSEELALTLANKRFDTLAMFVKKEWSLRKELSPGVTNHVVESIMAAATNKGALANKICGAGGGGCMISLVEKSKRAQVEKAIQDVGGRIIPFKIDNEGLRIQKTGEAGETLREG